MNSPAASFLSFTGKIHLINSDQELETVMEDLLTASELGFDTETRPSFKVGEVYKVALLQLSTADQAYVIRLHRLTQFAGLIRVFENENIVKVGVAIRDDLRQLQQAFKFAPKGFIELQTIAKTKGLKNMGLKGMTEEVLQASLNKGPKMTNWEAEVLTARQILYAATDAWIGLKIFLALK